MSKKENASLSRRDAIKRTVGGAAFLAVGLSPLRCGSSESSDAKAIDEPAILAKSARYSDVTLENKTRALEIIKAEADAPEPSTEDLQNLVEKSPAEFWDIYLDSYEKFNLTVHTSMVSSAVKAMTSSLIPAASHIVDLGSGLGTLGVALAESEKNVHLVDFSPNAHVKAKTLFAGKNVAGKSFIESDMRTLDYSTINQGTIHGITIINSLFSLESSEQYLVCTNALEALKKTIGAKLFYNGPTPKRKSKEQIVSFLNTVVQDSNFVPTNMTEFQFALLINSHLAVFLDYVQSDYDLMADVKIAAEKMGFTSSEPELSFFGAAETYIFEKT